MTRRSARLVATALAGALDLHSCGEFIDPNIRMEAP